MNKNQPLDVVVETAALGLASALRAWALVDHAPPPRSLESWYVANTARVELLIALAEEAVETLDPDLALSLMWAAWRAIGCVDEPPRLPANPYALGARECALQERLVSVATRWWWLFDHDEMFREHAISEKSVAPVLNILKQVRLARQREAEYRGCTAGSGTADSTQ